MKVMNDGLGHSQHSIYIIFDIDIPGMCNWLFVDIGGLTDDAHTQRTGGQGNTELS